MSQSDPPSLANSGNLPPRPPKSNSAGDPQPPPAPPLASGPPSVQGPAAVTSRRQPPPPPPRATLPPVAAPHASTAGTGRRQTLEQPASARRAEPPVERVTRPAESPADAAPRSRWRGEVPDESGVKNAANDAAGGSKGGAPDRTGEDDERELLAPVRKSMPAWLVSMIFHIALLLALALWTLPVTSGLRTLVLEFGEASESESVDLMEYSLESSDSDVQQETAEQESEQPVEFDVAALIESIDIAEPTDIVPVEMGASTSELLVKPMFGGRSGAMKAALLAMDGSPETARAVELGLKWLARQQRKDGSWSLRGPYEDGSYQENTTAATAMAMLAFQGDGNTHREGPYAKTVERGLKYLLNKQSKRDGFFAAGEPDRQQAYAQAQATIAICELYGMTQDSLIRQAAEAAIQFAVRAQSHAGGWRYHPRSDSDLSVTGWYVMALISGQSAGIHVEQSTLAAVQSYLDLVSVENGAGYSYQEGRPPSQTMTAEGLLCRQYLGWPRENEAMAIGLNTLVQDWPINADAMNVYYWYYGTQALHHYGGSGWTIWNNNMKQVLPAMQVKRGNEAGSWSPQADEYGNASGRLYTTCFAIYCLEVYYRHLPLYKLGKG